MMGSVVAIGLGALSANAAVTNSLGTNVLGINVEAFLKRLTNATPDRYGQWELVIYTNPVFSPVYNVWATNYQLWGTNYMGNREMPPLRSNISVWWSISDEAWNAVCLSNSAWFFATNQLIPPKPEVPVLPPIRNRHPSRYEIELPGETTAIRGDNRVNDRYKQQEDLYLMKLTMARNLAHTLQAVAASTGNQAYTFEAHTIVHKSIVLRSGACRTNDYAFLYKTDLNEPEWKMSEISYGKRPSEIDGCTDQCCEGPVQLAFEAPLVDSDSPNPPNQLFIRAILDRAAGWRYQP